MALQPFRLIRVTGPSMAPVFKNQELVWSSKFVGTLQRGDVVVFDLPEEGIIIKRVAFIPGDVIYTSPFAHGFGLPIQYKNNGPMNLKSVNAAIRMQKKGENVKKVVVPEGYVFLLGDNHMESEDSRYFGMVPISFAREKLLDARNTHM